MAAEAGHISILAFLVSLVIVPHICNPKRPFSAGLLILRSSHEHADPPVTYVEHRVIGSQQTVAVQPPGNLQVAVILGCWVVAHV